MIRTCRICGREFETTHPQACLCGDACRRKHKSNAVMASIAKNRTAARAAAKRFRERHPEQIAVYQAEYRTGQRRRDPSLPPIRRKERICTCIVCGAAFTATHWRASLCSDSCRHARALDVAKQSQARRRAAIDPTQEKET